MEQRNLLIAIVLSVGILIAFQFAFERMRPAQPPGLTQGTPATATASKVLRVCRRKRRVAPSRSISQCSTMRRSVLQAR